MLQNRLLYYESMSRQCAQEYVVAGDAGVFVVAISRTEAIVYDESRCFVRSCKIKRSSESRSSLLLLRDAAIMCEVSCKFYTSLQYLYIEVRESMGELVSRVRSDSNTAQISNSDIMLELLTMGLGISNIMQVTDDHSVVLEYAKSLYSSSKLSNYSNLLSQQHTYDIATFLPSYTVQASSATHTPLSSASYLFIAQINADFTNQEYSDT